MDEADIPMLVSRYINITMRTKKGGPVGYMKTTVYIVRVQKGHKLGTYCWADHV